MIPTIRIHCFRWLRHLSYDRHNKYHPSCIVLLADSSQMRLQLLTSALRRPEFKVEARPLGLDIILKALETQPTFWFLP